MTRARIAALVCVLLLAALGAACGRSADQGSEVDLNIAREAYSGGYFLEAETAYERYLQADPQGRHRLEAWTRLVDICSGVKGDPDKAVALLETATLEFSARPRENWPLLFRLGELYEQRGQRKKALDVWGRCLDTAGDDAVKIVQAQTRMAIADRALGKTDLAVELLTRSIGQAGDDATKSRIMYELAQTYSLTWNWGKTREILNSILAMNKAPQDLKIMSVFLLADAYEAERNLPKARELLLSIKDSYPNPEVIINRLANLGQHNESPAMSHLQPGDSPASDMANAGSSHVKLRRVHAK
ncbi:MAG: hypothetical protein AUJ49_12130 [Desulfovibrionaceae bacterium CG1_02_65_16]|nr:MAG: hypothetical protein AUJ49_12130 [Desulfovibrionaceae bacterium CG1_02_65_16]